MVSTKSRIIIALDDDNLKRVEQFIEQLPVDKYKLKVGKEMFTRFGPEFVKRLVDKGFDVFLDLKFHDIPNTVARACKAAADLGVWMMNVHALGGVAMLTAAKNALSDYGKQRPLLIAVTILTSLDNQQLKQIGFNCTTAQAVERLALLSYQAQLDGIVCSALDITTIQNKLPNDFLYITPGIRLLNNRLDDQARIMTPASAINAGASYLVIGRPVTQAENPCQILEEIQIDIDL